MDLSKEPEQECSGQVDNGSLAIVPVCSAAFIQVARDAGVQVQRRNSESSSTVQEYPVINQAKTLMPVNIKQIVDSWKVRGHSYMIINNTILSSVKVIGQVRGKQVDEYKGRFSIQDCSGAIKASIWFTTGRAELDRIPEGAFASAIGRVKIEGDSLELQCYDCRPIKNFNDITHHHLSVIATHIDCVQKPVKPVYERVAELWAQDMAGASDTNLTTFTTKKTATNREPVKKFPSPKKEILSQDYAPALNISEATLSASSASSHTGPILKLLRDEAPNFGPEGLNIDLICAKLKNDKEVVRKSLDILACDGEVYTTVDNDHFAAT